MPPQHKAPKPAELLRHRLDEQINMSHALVRLASLMSNITRVGVDLAKNVFVRPESRLSLCFTGGKA